MENQKNLSIIDIDSLFYQSSKDSIEESIVVFRDKLDNILKATSADYWCGFVTSGKCFRYSIDANYKANRTRPVPKYLNVLKAWAIIEYDLNVCTDVEADDMVVWLNNKSIFIEKNTGQVEFYENLLLDEASNPYELNKTICAIDKDIIQSVPGNHFNYTYKLEDKTNTDSVIKGWYCSQEDEFFFAKQLLMGDSSDNVKCFEGIGEKRAEKLMELWKEGNVESFIFDLYIRHYSPVSKGVYEFQKNYRLLHILENDDDFIREIGHLPEFPKINKVNKVVKEVIDF